MQMRRKCITEQIYYEEPDLAEALDFKDYGRGYYLTTNQSQAERWAIRNLTDNDINDVAYVYEYEFDTGNTDSSSLYFVYRF